MDTPNLVCLDARLNSEGTRYEDEAYWRICVLVYSCIDVLVYWCIGILMYWCNSVLVYWCIGVLV